MSKKSDSGKSSPTLPEDVHNLITRKLRHQRREQEKLLISAKQAAYSKLHEGVLANIRAQKLDRAFTAVPITAYRKIVASATAATKEWPVIVWETIASILSKAQVLPRDGLVLNKIVDEYAWAIDQNPFTLDSVDPKKFKESVCREAGRYGVDVPASFGAQLELVAAAELTGMLNHARHAREGIGIAIAEYVIAQRQDGQSGCAETEEEIQERTAAPLHSNMGEPNGKHPGHLNHDLHMQRRANEIATELTTSTRTPTRETVAKQLAKELDRPFDTVVRRIRKQW